MWYIWYFRTENQQGESEPPSALGSGWERSDNIIDTKIKQNNLFCLFKDSIVGGPRLYSIDTMKQAKHTSEMVVRYVKKDIGYDAIAQEMHSGKHEHVKE